MGKLFKKLYVPIITVLSLGLCFLSFYGVSSVSAYLTDGEKADNVATIGHVEIELSETEWPGNDSEEVHDKIANQEIPKNPVITNTGDNDAVVFLKVTVPVVNTIEVHDNGTKDEAKKQEIFFLKLNEKDSSIHENSFNANWVELPTVEAGTTYLGNTRTYVFGYKTRIAPNEKTTALFDKIQLKKTLEGNIPSGTAETILLDAYAIQADEIIKGDVIDTTVDLDEETLTSIYNIFITQNNLH
jgi:hypothetical protein